MADEEVSIYLKGEKKRGAKERKMKNGRKGGGKKRKRNAPRKASNRTQLIRAGH
jgi:hypothetical protein